MAGGEGVRRLWGAREGGREGERERRFAVVRGVGVEGSGWWIGKWRVVIGEV